MLSVYRRIALISSPERLAKQRDESRGTRSSAEGPQFLLALWAVLTREVWLK